MKRAQPICGYTLHVQFVYASCMAVSGESLRMPCEIIRQIILAEFALFIRLAQVINLKHWLKRLILQIFLHFYQHLGKAEIKHHTLYDTTRRS